MAKGDFIILADHDDVHSEHALYEVAKTINEHPDCDVIYSDETSWIWTAARCSTRISSGLQPGSLNQRHYICHLFVVKRSLLDQVGGFPSRSLTAPRTMTLSSAAESAKEIRHIPKVLYHWRCHQESTASNPESKLYAFEAGARAIMAHYERCGIPGGEGGEGRRLWHLPHHL